MTHAPKLTSFLKAISKRTLLDEATGINTMQTHPLRSTDILSASLNLSQQFSASLASITRPPRLVPIVADTAT